MRYWTRFLSVILTPIMLPYFYDSHKWLLENPNGILVVTGPTASGKTGYAIELAKHLQRQEIHAEIINADSRQIYTDLPLLTAVPTHKERGEIPHHLFECTSPKKTINVSEWRDLAIQTISMLHKQKKRAILCGGTGLWINALTKNFSLGVPPDKSFRAEMNQKTGEELHLLLQRTDPKEAKKLPPTNKKYIIRALEISKYKGSKTSASKQLPPPFPSFLIATTHPRVILYKRINSRTKDMFAHGVIQEVSHFLHQYPHAPENDSAFISHGVPEIIQYLSGIITENEVQEKMAQHTRNYAKRQLTWWRSDKRVNWIDMTKGSTMDIDDKQY